MTAFKTGLTQSLTTEDSLRIEVAKAQYVALQTDSSLLLYYEIAAELKLSLKFTKKEMDRYIKDNDKLRDDKVDLKVDLRVANGKVARSKKVKWEMFGIGLGTGTALGIIGVLAVIIGTK